MSTEGVDNMLHTTQQIAEQYGVTSYTITHNWIPKGLKHIPGARKSFLFRTEWVDEFIENQAEMCAEKRNKSNIATKKITRITKGIKTNKLKCFVI